jgi:tetratricopeptide (TPR) repeat protein
MNMMKYLRWLGVALLASTLFDVASANGQGFGSTGTVKKKRTDEGVARVRSKSGSNKTQIKKNYSKRQAKNTDAGEELAGADTKPGRPDYYSLGVKSFEGQQYDQALTYFNRELVDEPGQVNSLAYLGDTLTALKRYEEAIRNYGSAASKLGPDDKDDKAILYNKMGLAYEELNNSRGAAEAFQNAINLKPDFTDAYNSLAEAHMKLANWQGAVNSYTAMLGLADAKLDADGYYNLGLAYERLGRHAEAAANYNKSLELKENAETLYRLCQVNFVSKNWQGAVESCGKTVALDKSKGNVYYLLGDAYTELEMYPQAADSYLEVTKLNPKDFDAFIDLGVTYSNLGRHTEAITAFREALVINPESLDTHFKLGQVYSNAAMWSEALGELNSVIVSDPKNVRAYVLSGRASNRLDRMQDAIRFFNKALELEPTNDEAQYYLGTVYIKMRDQASALTQYNQLRAANSPRAERLYNEIRQNFPVQ